MSLCLYLIPAAPNPIFCSFPEHQQMTATHITYCRAREDIIKYVQICYFLHPMRIVDNARVHRSSKSAWTASIVCPTALTCLVFLSWQLYEKSIFNAKQYRSHVSGTLEASHKNLRDILANFEVSRNRN